MHKSKGLSRTQSSIVTLEMGWRYFLPESAPPLLPHIFYWLKHKSVDDLLCLMERAAREGRPSPARWIFHQLRREVEGML